MRCKQAEKAFLRSKDILLEERTKKDLEAHLASCPRCQAMTKEYGEMFGALEKASLPDTKPDFWLRLQVRLRLSETPRSLQLWKGLGFKNIAFASVILTLVFTAAAILLPRKSPVSQGVEISQTEKLLWQNNDLFQEVQSVFDQEDPASKNISLIFADLNGQSGKRREIP